MKKTFFVAIAALAGLVAFTQQKQTKQPPPPKVNLEKFVPPPPPPTQPSKVQAEHLASPNNPDYKEFLKRNPTVKRITWAYKNTVRIYLKSGKQETYDLKKEKDMQSLKNKYGELPAAPPSPPKVNMEKFAPPVQKGT
jgi:hypothetical protein